MRIEKSFLLLVGTLAAVATIVTAVSIFTLYRVGLSEERARLVALAQSQARLIESVGRFDAEFSAGDVEGGAVAATFGQVVEAHERLEGWGASGEFLIGSRRGDTFVFLARPRLQTGANKPIPVASTLAEPMRRALRGETGTIIDLDYRGVTVLAAYEPVDFASTGIVAKIDLAEVRAPFIRAGAISAAVALAAILVGAVLFSLVVMPLTRRMRRMTDSLSEAQSLAHVGNWAWDIPADITTWSDEAFRIFGHEPQEFSVIHEKFMARVHPDDRALVEEAIRLALEEGKTYQIDHRVVRPDGTERIVEEHGQAFFDASGKAVRLAGTVQDITERRVAEQALRENEERWNLFTDSATEAFVLFDPTFTLIDINAGGARQFGFESRDALLGRSMGDLSGGTPDPKRAAAYLNVLETGEPLEVSGLPFGSGEHQKILNIKVFKAGENLGMIAKDVTEQVAAEEKLRRSQELRVSFMESATESFVLFDSKLNFLEINTAGLRTMGLRREEVIGRNLADLIPKSKEMGYFDRYLAVLETGEPLHLDRVNIHQTHKDLIRDVRVFPVGDGLGMISVDVTEQVAAEQAARESEELRRSFMDSATESFVVLNHDLDVVDINKAALDRIKMMRHEAIGCPINTVAPKAISSGRLKQYREVLETGIPLILEGARTNNFSGDRIMDVRVFPVADGLGMILHDVTERRAAEEALRQERNLVTSIFDTSSAILVVADRTGRILRFNRASEIVSGYSAEEVTGEFIWDSLMAPERGEFVKAQFANIDDRVYEGEQRSEWVTRDGSRRIISMANSKICDEGGRVEYLTAIGVDITERTRAEEALEESNERFRSIYENGVAGILMLTPKGDLIDVNSTWCDILGYERDEMIGRSITEFINREDFEGVTQKREQLGAGQITSYRLEARYFHKDGRVLWALTSVTGVRDRDGNVQFFIGVVQDITEIKTAGEKVRRSEERMRAVIDNAPIMIWTTDREGVLTMVEGNVRPLASGEAGTLGRSMFDIRADDPEVLEKLRGALRGGSHSYVRDMSGHGLFETRIGPLRGADGKVTGIVGVARDVAEEYHAKRELEVLNGELERRVAGRTRELEKSRDDLKLNVVMLRQAQDQLVQSEKFASLGGLVAGVAHEINTPVGIAVTAASHLRESAEGLNDNFRDGQMKRADLEGFLGSADEATRIILGNLSRASDLVKSFKQVAVDQSNDELRGFQVAEYVREILLNLRPQLKKRGHNVTLSCDETLYITSYAGALAQIVTNFIMNSITHAYPGDERGEIAIEILVSNGRCELTYTDDGQGIAKDDVAKIFDPFFTTRRGSGGTGLGLNIVHNLVTQTLGGSINCASEVGFGTTFVVAFPVAEGARHVG